MPSITLTLSHLPPPEMSDRIAEEIAQLTCEALRKELALTTVLVRHQPADRWYNAGRKLSEDGRRAFRLEVTVTDETNTKIEKSDFHARAFALLAGLLGETHPRSCIHVVDCRGSAYGYGGLTQEARNYLPAKAPV